MAVPLHKTLQPRQAELRRHKIPHQTIKIRIIHRVIRPRRIQRHHKPPRLKRHRARVIHPIRHQHQPVRLTLARFPHIILRPQLLVLQRIHQLRRKLPHNLVHIHTSVNRMHHRPQQLRETMAELARLLSTHHPQRITHRLRHRLRLIIRLSTILAERRHRPRQPRHRLRHIGSILLQRRPLQVHRGIQPLQLQQIPAVLAILQTLQHRRIKIRQRRQLQLLPGIIINNLTHKKKSIVNSQSSIHPRRANCKCIQS